jgi:hypothetical protein
MTIAQLGDLGGFLGGIGVLVTLVYLALQIRKNTQAVRSASLDSVSASHSEFLDRVGQDPELTKLWFDGLSGEIDLSETDARRVTILLISVARRWESASYRVREGTLDSSAWAGIHAELTIVFSSPGAQTCWKTIRILLSPDFVVFAERAIRCKGQSE